MKEFLILIALIGGGVGVVKVVGMSYAVYQNCIETRKDIESVTKQSDEMRREREKNNERLRTEHSDR